MAFETTIDHDKVYVINANSAKAAEVARLKLLDLGIPFAWADDEPCHLTGQWHVSVRRCDARGAYTRYQTWKAENAL